MTWADLIITLVAASLAMAMNYLETMPGYSCPKYCGTEHIHFGIGNPIPTDELVLDEKSIKPGS